MFLATRCGVMSKKGSATPQPAWSNVILLMHMEGSDGGTTFANAKNPASTFTVGAGAYTSTSSKKFGASSLYANSTTAKVRPDDFSIGVVGSVDFCIEFFMRMSTVASSSHGGVYATGASTGSMILSCGSSGIAGTDNRFNAWLNSNTLTSTTTVTDGAWHHIAITRSGTTARLFVDGVQEASGTNSVNFNAWDTWYCGILYGYHYAQIGTFIDEFRITKGEAVYTVNFTPPTAAFPEF